MENVFKNLIFKITIVIGSKIMLVSGVNTLTNSSITINIML